MIALKTTAHIAGMRELAFGALSNHWMLKNRGRGHGARM
jgi:hypothetical protein